MADSVKIKGVSCYGTVEDNSNYYMVGDDGDGYELDGVWIGDAERNWTEVVNKVLAAYDGCEIYEITAV